MYEISQIGLGYQLTGRQKVASNRRRLRVNNSGADFINECQVNLNKTTHFLSPVFIRVKTIFSRGK